jgi:hypothetical protein
MVFSHPNHELAVFGLVQRLRPRLVFLTDGGGRRRVDETRRGLDGLGLLANATFLDHPEDEFYARLLSRDHGYWRVVVRRLREALATTERVLCDAVEFYNPVHDLSLPLVRAAVPDVPVFEVPLVYQRPGAAEAYSVQRVPPSRAATALALELTTAELERKLTARAEVYRCLDEQMGPVLATVPPDCLAREEIMPASAHVPAPDGERVLRYDWRARVLLEAGAVREAITWGDHYAPVAAGLTAP